MAYSSVAAGGVVVSDIFIVPSVNGSGKVDHVGGLIVDSPSGTFCRRP